MRSQVGNPPDYFGLAPPAQGGVDLGERLAAEKAVAVDSGEGWAGWALGTLLRAGVLLTQQCPEPRLYEMPVKSEGIGNTGIAHHDKRDAVNQAPLFVLV